MREQVRGSLLDPQPDMATVTHSESVRDSGRLPFGLTWLLASMTVALVIALWFAARRRS